MSTCVTVQSNKDGKKEGTLTVRVVVLRQLHCTAPGTGVCAQQAHEK